MGRSAAFPFTPSSIDRCVPFVLSAHTLVIAVIAVPYFGLMAGLCAWMACQVRYREPGHADEDLADLDVRDDDPDPDHRCALRMPTAGHRRCILVVWTAPYLVMTANQ